MTERDDHGWPVRMVGGVRVCARRLCAKGALLPAWVKAHFAEVCDPGFVYPPCGEFRINGYCSGECEDMDELEQRITALEAELAEKREENETWERAARYWFKAYREKCGHSSPENEQRLGELHAPIDRLREAVRKLGEAVDLLGLKRDRFGRAPYLPLRGVEHYSEAVTAVYEARALHIVREIMEETSVEVMIRRHGLAMPSAEVRKARLDRETGKRVAEEPE